ncbi:hypothetical protein [Oceanomicrobium pacificus]|uniref:Uncharacterized protein n=1 Tax=Oceanomicrobium pacificus TaxID=2692916 RepID=A0A6B0TRK5_9RHOB|nr:hypothetical protein [Oceanomicrobium pacificus]MXU63994.1 hypothetical protein [Oceanomicrobium pacificus]
MTRKRANQLRGIDTGPDPAASARPAAADGQDAEEHLSGRAAAEAYLDLWETSLERGMRDGLPLPATARRDRG